MKRRDFLRKSIQTTFAVSGAAALSSPGALVAHASGSEGPGSEQQSKRVLQATVNEGDWVEGAPQWWWKYVFPVRVQFWSTLLAERVKRVRTDPEPHPWKEQVLGELLEATAMLHAMSGIDVAVDERLKGEAKTKIVLAVRAIR